MCYRSWCASQQHLAPCCSMRCQLPAWQHIAPPLPTNVGLPAGCFASNRCWQQQQQQEQQQQQQEHRHRQARPTAASHMWRLLWSPAVGPETLWSEPRRGMVGGNPVVLGSAGSRREGRIHRRNNIGILSAATSAAAGYYHEADHDDGAADAAADATSTEGTGEKQQQQEEKEGEKTRQAKADLRALLNALSLKESDVMAELSKKNQELLNLGQEEVMEDE
ncbi:unnamed protein product, partial [Laminaria digitata]